MQEDQKQTDCVCSILLVRVATIKSNYRPKVSTGQQMIMELLKIEPRFHELYKRKQVCLSVLKIRF